MGSVHFISAKIIYGFLYLSANSKASSTIRVWNFNTSTCGSVDKISSNATYKLSCFNRGVDVDGEFLVLYLSTKDEIDEATDAMVLSRSSQFFLLDFDTELIIDS